MNLQFFISTISLGAVYLFGSLGEIITEKSGHLNLGIPGIMCMGTVGGCLGASVYMGTLANPQEPVYILLLLTVIAFSIAFSVFGGLIYGFITVSLKCNQNITGLALTTFGAGFTEFFMTNFVDKTYLSKAGYTLSKIIDIPSLGNVALDNTMTILFENDFFVYLALVLAIVSACVIKFSRVGLNLRSVGENPGAADAAGINVTGYKYSAIVIGSAIAGLGGATYLLCFIKGSWENAETISAIGWVAIALVIFSLWKPSFAIIGSFIFGLLSLLPNAITGISFSMMKLLKLLPYVVTVLVLIITSLFNSKENQGPAAIGLSYFREER